MGIINQALPNLINGISQQPPNLRHTSQLEVMENCVPSAAVGLRKRTGSQYFNKVLDYPAPNAFIHPINRGTTGTKERYFVLIDGGDLKVLNWMGEAQAVSFPDGRSYLASLTPRDDFAACTVADYTFLVNKTVKCALGPASDSGVLTPTLYVNVKLGVIKQDYYVNLNGTLFQYNATGDDAPHTTAIAAALASDINAGAVFTATAIDNLIVIKPIVPGPFSYTVADTYGNQAIMGFMDTVNRFEELPRQFVTDVVVRIQGEPNAAEGAWYAKWERPTSGGDGVWVECATPNALDNLDASTLPHQLVRNADASWVFQVAPWAKRLVGDDLSIPPPSFIGSTVNDVFFFRNRLGVLADENLIMSEAGNYFNFWGTSARTVVDSDSIDVSASTTKVTFLRYAIPFNKSMLIMSEKTQFVLSGEPTLTPKTIRLDPTTEFETSQVCRPVAIGRNVYFPVNRGAYTGMREYYLDTGSLSNDADDITSHCPAYIPTGVFRLAAVATEDMVLALTTSERNAVYVYNTYWTGDQKQQSAWGKWVYGANDTIVSADMFGSTMAMFISRPDGLFLDMTELEERPYSPTGYTICLDRWVGYQAGTYDAQQKTTTWQLPFLDNDPYVVIICNQAGNVGQGLIPTRPASNLVSVKGDFSAALVVIGKKFNAKAKLSRLYMRDAKTQAVVSGRLQLRTIAFNFDRTGFFQVNVYPQARPVNTNTYTARDLGMPVFSVGKAVVTAGKFRVPIMAKSDEVEVELVSDSHLPFVLQTAEWEGHFAMQASRP